MLFTIPNRDIINRTYVNLIFSLRLTGRIVDNDINETLKSQTFIGHKELYAE